MKKLITLCLLISLCLCCFASCNGAYQENTWFAEEKLTDCLVSDLPKVTKESVNHNDENVFVSFTDDEFKAYVESVYDYLRSQEFKYFGTRGEEKDSLAGMLTTYYFKPATELSEFYVDSAYRFVYSDGSVDENGDLIFSMIYIYDYETRNLGYDSKRFSYNTVIKLCYKSEAPLGGFYTLRSYAIIYETTEAFKDGFMPTEAKAGDTVVLRTGRIIDADLDLYANGVKCTQTHADSDYWEYVFTMPECDVVITSDIIGGM